MLYKILSFCFCCLILFSACKESSAQIPEENFSVVQGKFENGVEIIGSFNMSYLDYSNKKDYPWCLQLVVEMNQDSLYPNRLPINSESTLAYLIEDELLAAMRKITTPHYVGHVFYDGALDIFIYLKSPEAVNQYLQTKLGAKDYKRNFAFEIREDPKWESVASYLK